ncbi:type II toxin-antitoxin system Phd/YefM family antitoxin [Desulfomicrobium salsuginis]
MTTWQIQEAKNKFSELIDKTLSEGPQVVTKHGTEVAVVIPIEQFRRLTAPKQRLGDFLLNSPLRNSELVIKRDQTTELREIDL